VTSTGEPHWPGEYLGLPETGPRSIARLGPRVVALCIDWALAYILSLAFFSTGEWQTNGWITLALFSAGQLVFLVLLNGSIGHLLLRIRLVPVQAGLLGPWRPLVRTLLLCVVVPAIIWDADQRGLHDRAAGTILVRV
jgi:hypothetical protein